MFEGLIQSAHEGSYESAASAVRFPIDIKTRAAIGIGQGYGRHGVSQLRQRRIKSYLVAANMIFAVYGA